jgi:hypothetical protein
MHRLKQVRIIRLLGVLAAAIIAAPVVHAQSVEEFYAGKVVTLTSAFLRVAVTTPMGAWLRGTWENIFRAVQRSFP